MKLSMDVVCAGIKSVDIINKGRNDLFLIAKRAKNKIHAGKWEFPGGKVEHEENHSDAVKREVIDELGAEIKITGLQDPIQHSYNHVKIWLCHMSVNSPTTAQSPKERKWSTWS
jgi:mutator protein MutT